MKYSIIIPVYNEAATVGTVLDKILALRQDFLAENKNAGVEVIVVNDGSTDKTAEILKATENEVKILAKSVNEGKTKGITDAVKISSGDYVAIQDGDAEYDPQDLFNIFRQIEQNHYEVVYGSRLLKKNGRFSFFYYYGSRMITNLYNILFHDHITDLTTCYKVFRKDLVNFDKVDAERFGFCAQITCQLKKRGSTIVEFPISYHPRSFSEGKKIRLRDGIQFISIIVKSRFERST